MVHVFEKSNSYELRVDIIIDNIATCYQGILYILNFDTFMTSELEVVTVHYAG